MARVRLTDVTIGSTLVLAIASLVVADTGLRIPTECPKTDIGNVTVNLAHETDCTKYYGCSGGKKWLKECPLMDAQGNRLHFNPSLQVCDWPQNVNCKLPNGRAPIMFKAGGRAECPKVDPVNETVHLAHETDCGKFYKCSQGVKYEMECPVFNEEGDRLSFNASLQVCDWPWNVDCEEPKITNLLRKVLAPRKAVEFATKVPTKCPRVDAVNETVHLAHETDCAKFYKCSQGVKHEMKCPVFNEQGDRLFFNASLQVCDWPWNVDCEEPKIPNMLPKVLAPRKADEFAAAVPKKCPKVDAVNETVHLAHETDCAKFYKCSQGVKHEMECPVFNEEGDRLFFNASLQVCDWPWNVDCEERKITNMLRKVLAPRETVVLTAEIPTQCPKVDPADRTVNLAHETDCTKYYACSHGKKLLMDCPYMNEAGDKLYFNPETQLCDFPENAKCNL